jgi:hypothetical protein
MASTFRLILDGAPADEDLYTKMSSLEVEENIDLPGAIQINLPVIRTKEGELSFVSDKRFRPLAKLAVVATAEGKSPECIFDGHVLSHKLHLQTGTVASTLQVWGQDASWLMNLEEKVKEWVDITDADAANAIFGDYPGITPASENAADASPAHTEDGHSLMQRGSDIEFLRRLARANGKICRVACADRPGRRIGYFAKPKLDGDPVATLTLNDPEVWTVKALDIEWDAMRPTAVKARQALFNDKGEDGGGADTADSGLALLDARGLATFTGRPLTVLLAAPVDDAGELTLRAQSLLREAGWFVHCEGETEVSRLKAVLRAGTVVLLEGIGSLHSGKYFVWSVRHRITKAAHTMKFVLVRNAVGPA